jgi:hypothetical protein
MEGLGLVMKDNLKVGDLSNFLKRLDPGQARVQIPAQAGLERSF